MRKKRYKYDFAAKKEAGDGKASVVYAVISFAFVLVSFCSVYFGISEAVAGAVGLAATLLSLAGFFIGLKSLRNQETSHSFGIFGTVANGLLAVLWIGLYLAGIN